MSDASKTTVECEVFILVDDEGQYVAHHDGGEIATFYEEQVGGELKEREGFRVVRLVVNVPLPRMLELRGEVPADEQPGELRVA